MMKCPWCGEWEPQESFIALQMPPVSHPHLAPIYKHGNHGTCNRLFAVAETR